MRKTYHYFYQAAIRSQLACGATMGKYVEWKASIPLIALDIWWTLIVVSWLRPIREIVLRGSYPPIFLLVGAVCIIHAILMGPKRVQENYRREFLAWSKRKRRICDSLVASFHILTVALFVWSAFESKRDLYPS